MLEELFRGASEDADARKEVIGYAELEHAVSKRRPAIDVAQALRPSEKVRILAEIKRASPSKGQIAEIPSASALAGIYESNGASAISVLTEGRKFKGSLQDLSEVRAAVSLPLLRKDFISNEYQLLEARAHGADIALLIVAGLQLLDLQRLYAFTTQLGMMPFIETHSKRELDIANDLGAKMIGVNARDLDTFETDRDLFAKLADSFSPGTIKVAESAVRDEADVRRYRDAGADVVLVGEALVSSDPSATLRTFLQ